jgi:small subunit ribosomal protein S4
MGDPKFSRKQWSSPSHPWVGARIKSENALRLKYGLKNKREIWKAAGKIRAWRTQARELQARLQRLDKQADRERDLLIAKLTRLGLLKEGSTLDDILAMDLELILHRRFQSQVFLKGLAKTTGHARQLIGHGHLAIGGQKVTVPGYILKHGEEDRIGYYLASPMNASDHAMRPPPEFRGAIVDIKIEEDQDQGRGFRRRAHVRVPVPADQVDETVGPVSPAEKGKDIVDVKPALTPEEEEIAKTAVIPAKPEPAKGKGAKPKEG